MRRTTSGPTLFASPEHSELSAELYKVYLLAAFEDAILRTLASDWELQSITRESLPPADAYKVKLKSLQHNHAEEFQFKFPQFVSYEEVALSLRMQTEILNINLCLQASPNQHDIKILGADYKRNRISISHPLYTGMPLELEILSDCYDELTGTFSLVAFKKAIECNAAFIRASETATKMGRSTLIIDINDMPATITSPLPLTAEHIRHGIRQKHVVLSPLDPGKPFAVYISGADPLLGAWKTAIRLNYNTTQKAWRFTLPEGLELKEFKFLVGPYDPRRVVSTAELKWDDGDNKLLDIQCTPVQTRPTSPFEGLK
jgi:hypothetical protein